MASTICDPNNRKRIAFKGLDGIRRVIRLGKCDKQFAEYVAARVEAILFAAAAGMPLDHITADWLTEAPPAMYEKLVAVGLVVPRESTATDTRPRLGKFLDDLLARCTDLKKTTRTVYAMTIRNLKAFFKADRLLTDITAGEAEDFRRWLLKTEKLALATAGRRCGLAADFFRDAMKRRLIQENPFSDIDRSVRDNPDRQRFIDEWHLDFA